MTVAAVALYANFHGAQIETFRRRDVREFCKIVLIKLSRIKAPDHVHFVHEVMTTLLWELDELSARCQNESWQYPQMIYKCNAFHCTV